MDELKRLIEIARQAYERAEQYPHPPLSPEELKELNWFYIVADDARRKAELHMQLLIEGRVDL